MEESKPIQLRVPWSKGKLVGQKCPLKLKEIWRSGFACSCLGNVRDLALFNLAIESKLRGCDLVQLRVCELRKQDVSPRALSSCSGKRDGRCSVS